MGTDSIWVLFIPQLKTFPNVLSSGLEELWGGSWLFMVIHGQCSSDVSEWTIRKDGGGKGSDEATTSATD